MSIDHSQIIIRKAKKSDISILVKLDQELVDYQKPFSTIKKMGSIEAAYVKEEFRKNAIGELMTETALAWFKSRKINFITGAVNANNEVAKNFWLKMGASLQGYYFKKIL